MAMEMSGARVGFRCRFCLKVTKPIVNCCFGVRVSCYGSTDRNMLENSLESPTTKESGTELLPTLTRLPLEIVYAIIEHLRMDGIVILRDVSQFFRNFIYQLTNEQLLAEEKAHYAYRRTLYEIGRAHV